MRRSRRIYKRKTRSNMETLIILVGAIIILSVAFYMAREKSFVPPTEMQKEQKTYLEERLDEKVSITQKLITDPETQNGIESKKYNEQEISSQPETNFIQENKKLSQEQSSTPMEPSLAQDNTNVVTQVVEEKLEPKEITQNVDQTVISGTVHTVQVGYFSVETNARDLAREIEGHGFQTHIIKHDNAFKLQVGAYREREQAEEASRKLKKLGYEIWITQR